MHSFSRLMLSLGLVVGSLAAQSKSIEMVDVLALLQAEVPSSDILALLKSSGLPKVVEEGDLAQAKGFGANSDLLNVLGKRLRAFQKLQALARSFEVWESPERDVSVLRPRGWVVTPKMHPGGFFLDMSRQAVSEHSWFRTPRIFIWIQRGTTLPSDSQVQVSESVARVIERRLRRAKMEPHGFTVGLGNLAGRNAPEQRMKARSPKVKFAGELVIRSRILQDGTMITAGMVMPDGESNLVEPLFNEVARSLVVYGSTRPSGSPPVLAGVNGE